MNYQARPEAFFESLKTFVADTSRNDAAFYAKDIRKYFRLHPMQLKRFLDELEGRGFIKCRSRHIKRVMNMKCLYGMITSSCNLELMHWISC